MHKALAIPGLNRRKTAHCCPSLCLIFPRFTDVATVFFPAISGEANKKKLPRNERLASSNNEGLSKSVNCSPPRSSSTIVPIPTGPSITRFHTPPTSNPPPKILSPFHSTNQLFIEPPHSFLFNCSIIIQPSPRSLENNFSDRHRFTRTRHLCFCCRDDRGNTGREKVINPFQINSTKSKGSLR